MQESLFSLVVVAIVVMCFCLVCLYIELRKQEKRAHSRKRAFAQPSFTVSRSPEAIERERLARLGFDMRSHVQGIAKRKAEYLASKAR